MTLADLIAEFRAVRDDLLEPQNWSDEQITAYLNEAVMEACIRAKLIEDRLTDDCCLLSLEDGAGSYSLHASVIAVKRVTLAGRALEETSVEKEDERDTFWENRTANAPLRWMMDGDSRIRFVPVPLVATDVRLTVYRTPLQPMAADGDEPEVPAIYHKRLLPWAYFRALSKKDSEAYDQQEADRSEAAFTASFGIRPDANVVRKQRDRRPPVVRMGDW